MPMPVPVCASAYVSVSLSVTVFESDLYACMRTHACLPCHSRSHYLQMKILRELTEMDKDGKYCVVMYKVHKRKKDTKSTHTHTHK